MKIFVDLDNTLCVTHGLEYQNSKPIFERIKIINELYDKGNIITIYTARGSVSKIDYFDLTERQLKKWGIKYNNLSVGEKPDYDLLVDDKAISDKSFFNHLTRNKDDYNEL
jgi:hypothetical protein